MSCLDSLRRLHSLHPLQPRRPLQRVRRGGALLRALRPAFAGLSLLLVSACESSSTADVPAANGGNGGSSPGPTAGKSGSGASGTAAQAGSTASTGGAKTSAAGLYGAFTLTLYPELEATAEAAASPPRSAFIGAVNDGEKASPMAWTEKQSAAGCKLFTPASPLCDPSCGSSAVCVADNTCQPYPKALSVGTVTLKGVALQGGATTPIEMQPIGTGKSYQPSAGTMLAYPPCTEGAPVSLSVEGGGYESFELQSKCIAPLEFKGPIALKKDMPLKLTWTAPSDPKLARIAVKLNISHHGGSRGEIRCDVEDTGQLEIPKEMATALLDLGVAGFPTVVLTRIVTGGVAAGEPKNVQLVVQEPVERTVEIDGLISCTPDDTDVCPAGQTCQADLTCK